MDSTENKVNTENQPDNGNDNINRDTIADAEAAATTADDNEEINNKESNNEEGNNNDKQSRRSRRRHADNKNDELNAKIEELGNKLLEMNDKYLRIYSEYENYRKRTNAEKAGLILNGGKDVVKLMLPIVDDMERAIANMADDDSAKEGLQLILKNMLNALQQKGLKPMEALGAKFDENFHEAITQIPAPSPEAKGTVIDVVKKGYFLNEDVLRFAQVVVAN